MIAEPSTAARNPTPRPARHHDRLQQFVAFAVGDRSFAIDILTVREIRQPSRLTPLPDQPDHVRGVLNLRGAIVPVHDMGLRFGASRIEPASLTVIIIVEVGTRMLGMMVDTVSDILAVPPDSVRPIPAGADTPYLTGFLEQDDAIVTVLALDHLFAGAEAPG